MGDLHNPYAPPTADEVFAEPSERFTYQSSEGLATGLRVLLAVTAAVLVINAVMMSMQAELLQRATRGTITMAEAEANDQRVLLATAAYLLALLATGIVWCIWQNRTSKNARALGAEHMQFGPNAWGWFFCPVINLWRPAAVISELWTATTSDRSQDASIPNWLLGGWWLPWLLGNVVSWIAGKLAENPDDLSSLISSSQWRMVADGLLAISGVFAIVLVTKLQQRERASAAQRRR